MATLPTPVVDALYNIAPDGRVPGHQLAFHCFNYGSLGAISYAAGLPWLDLYQARRMRGWRPRSFGLLLAVMRTAGALMAAPYTPSQIMPRALASAVEPLTYWFVIGGQAVRCFAPYRPSRDVDFGIDKPANLDDMVAQLSRQGHVEIQERTRDTVHLLWDGLKVSVFVLDSSCPTSKTGISTSRACWPPSSTRSWTGACGATSSIST